MHHLAISRLGPAQCSLSQKLILAKSSIRLQPCRVSQAPLLLSRSARKTSLGNVLLCSVQHTSEAQLDLAQYLPTPPGSLNVPALKIQQSGVASKIGKTKLLPVIVDD